MYCPEALKLNKFVDVDIPCGKDIFSRFGRSEAKAEDFTGDDVSAPLYQSKLDSINAQIEDMLNSEG